MEWCSVLNPPGEKATFDPLLDNLEKAYGIRAKLHRIFFYISKSVMSKEVVIKMWFYSIGVFFSILDATICLLY